MRREVLLKLVRDKIGTLFPHVDIVYKPIDDREERIRRLRFKLVEEALEYLENPSLDELADILEVAQGLALRDLGYTWRSVVARAEEKARERGGFDAAIGMYARSIKEER